MGVGLDLDLVVVLGWPKGPSRHRSATTRCCPTTSAQAAGGELPLTVRARSSASTASCWPRLAGARSMCCASPGATCAGATSGCRRAGCRLASALAGERLVRARTSPRPTSSPGSTTSPRSTPGSARSRFPATEQEHRLRAIVARRTGVPRRLGRRATRSVAAGVEVVSARRSHRLHPLRRQPRRADRSVAGRARRPRPPGSRGGPLPVRLLRARRSCVSSGREPRGPAQISPLDQGSLVHEVLEDFITECARPPEADAAGSPRSPGPTADRGRPARDRGAVCDEYEAHGLIGRPSSGAGPDADPRRPRALPRREDARHHARTPAPARWPPSWPSASRRRRRARRPAAPRRPRRPLPGHGRPGRRRPPTAPSTSSTTRPGRPTTTRT